MPSRVYRFGPFRYDCGQRLSFERMRWSACAQVAETLRVLLERHGAVVEKAELMREVLPIRPLKRSVASGQPSRECARHWR